MSTDPTALSIQDEARVVRVQALVRRRLARKRGESAATEHYRKCYDALSGFAYYCNLRTGAATWHKPALLGASDVDWIDMTTDNASVVDGSDSALHGGTSVVTVAAEQEPLERDRVSRDEVDRLDGETTRSDIAHNISASPLSVAQRQQRFDDSVAFQQQCAQDKLALQHRHRRKVARAMQRWDRQVLADKQQRRTERLAHLQADNQQRLQDLYDGKVKQNVETIREAAMRGHIGRVRELLESGFSADAASAMGLTPLLAACQNGQYDAVKLLLASGADANHVHVTTGRTALMEAAARANASIVKELLRAGAQLHVRDAHGESAFDGVKDAGICKVLAMASGVWAVDNAPLFPTAFRRATLALALVAKRQRASSNRKAESTRREVATARATLLRQLAEAKVRYDADVRTGQAQITVLRKLEALVTADARFDAERSRVLQRAQDALDLLCSARQQRYLTESVVCAILSYCGRHWFEADETAAEPVNAGGDTRTRHKPRRRKPKPKRMCAIQPTKYRAPPDTLPADLVIEWDAFETDLQRHCELLRDVETHERADVASGVARTLDGTSCATLDVCVVEAEHLPLRDPRTGEAASDYVPRTDCPACTVLTRVGVMCAQQIDAFVRVWLDSGGEATQAFETDVRLADRSPVWEHSARLAAVSTIHAELRVQVVDAKRDEVAGEVAVALRSLLDQKAHADWHVLPPTLRQQLLERGAAARGHAARIRLRLQFTHTRAIVLTRELQQRLKRRDALVQQRRECIQRALTERLEQLQ